VIKQKDKANAKPHDALKHQPGIEP
jgi:hypothetical protein